MMIAPYIGNDKLADDNPDGNTGHLICHLAVDMNGRIGRSLDCLDYVQIPVSIRGRYKYVQISPSQ